MAHPFSRILLLLLCSASILGSSITLLKAEQDGIEISLDGGWEEEPGETDPQPDTEKLIPSLLSPEFICYSLNTDKLLWSKPLFLDTYERDIIAPPPEFRIL